MAQLVGLDERIDYLKRKGYKVATFEEMKTEPAPPGGWAVGDDYRAFEAVYDPQGNPVAPHDAYGEPLPLSEQWAEAFFLHGRKGKKGYLSL